MREKDILSHALKNKEEDKVHLKTLKPIKNKQVETFLTQQLNEIKGNIYQIKDRIYLKENEFIQLDKIKTLREGTLLGEIVKERFVPHHHFYMSMNINNLKNVCELNKEQASIFISGNVLNISGYKGYVALAYLGHIIGFGKGDNIQIKNHYPKGLRGSIDFK